MTVKILTSVLLLCSIITPAHGVCKSGALTAFEQVALDAHNEERAKHQDTPNLCYGKSGDDITFTSQSWAVTIAENKQMSHSSGDYGENVAYAATSGTVAAQDAAYESAVSRWYAEIEYWDFATSAKAASAPANKATGHFTQLVWTDSVQVNCGYDTYVDGSWNGYMVVCQYYPRGNYNNNYAAKVKPLLDTDSNTDDTDSNTDDSNTNNNYDTNDGEDGDDEGATDGGAASLVTSGVLIIAATLRVLA